MGNAVTQGPTRNPFRPAGIGGTQRARRAGIGVYGQQYQRRRTPLCPTLQTGLGAPKTPKPCHRGAREGTSIIARTRDDRNRHDPGQPAPVAPTVQLGQIIRPHQPYKAVFRPTPSDPRQGIDGVARAQFALHGGDANQRPPRLAPRRGVAFGQRRHTLRVLQRVAGADQPPHFVQPQRRDGREADPPMPAMRGVKAAA